jgi:hypothetical protein
MEGNRKRQVAVDKKTLTLDMIVTLNFKRAGVDWGSLVVMQFRVQALACALQQQPKG